MLLLENCHERWPDLTARKAANPRKKITYCKKDVDDPTNLPDREYVNLENERTFRGRYTSTDHGQKKFGGWSNEGLRRYLELRQMCREARAKPETRELELAILQRVRQINGVTSNSWEEHRRKLGRKTPTAVANDPNAITGLFDPDEVY